MPLMAMSDSIMRSRRYPVQPTTLSGLGDDPAVEQFQEGYQTYIKQWLPYLIKHKAPPAVISRIKEEIKNKRWQRAHDVIQLYFQNPKNPMLPYIFQKVGPVAGAPKVFGIAEHKSCCSGCASGAPCCGHDHGASATFWSAGFAILFGLTAPPGQKIAQTILGAAIGWAIDSSEVKEMAEK